MKRLMFLISTLAFIAVNGQQSVQLTIKRSSLNNTESFSGNRQRVWETLSNLPIESSDWRQSDLRKSYLDKWKKEIFGTNIYYVSHIADDPVTPSMYYATTPEGKPSRIELDSTKFTLEDDLSHCVEHELGHAAFAGISNVPGWLLYLGDITSKHSGTENALAHERIVMAVVVRRDIIDHYRLPLNAVITATQLKDYIAFKTGGMDYGLRWLIETTREERLLPLVNFENGYEINEKLET